MRSFFLCFAACALLACGGKVVLDGDGGSTTSGQGGGSADGGACAGLLAALDAADEAARVCEPDAPNTCTTTVPDRCGCLVIASTQGNGVAEAEAAYQAARAAGCICFTACPASPTSGSCAPTSSGGSCRAGPADAGA